VGRRFEKLAARLALLVLSVRPLLIALRA